MVVCTRGRICKNDANKTVIKRGSIYLANGVIGNTQQYSYPGVNINDWTKGDTPTYNGMCSRGANAGIAFSSKCLTFFHSVSMTPSSDYSQITPYNAADVYDASGVIDCVKWYNNYGNDYIFYPDENDQSFYVRFTFENISTYSTTVRFRFVRDNTVLYNFARTYAGTQNYLSGPYRGVIIGESFPWLNAKDDFGNENTFGYSRLSVTSRYWLKVGGLGTLSDMANGITIYNGSTVDSTPNPQWWSTWIGGFQPSVPDDDNPYWNGGTSTIGGGDGNFSDDSDSVDVDNLPTYDAVGTGFATLFTPTKPQLKALADVMWDSNIFTALQNLVENIQNMFTSLAIVPFQVTAGDTVEVNWLGLPITEIFLTLASQQYYEFDMGYINMLEDDRIFSSGSALDYSPYSKLGIFLPFIGYEDLDIDECRDAVIGLKYRIDILSGTCVALISINGNTIYQFTGNCLSQIPITNENMQSLVSDAVNVGIAAAATHSAMGAASADMAAAEGSGKISEAARDAKIAHAQAHVTSSAGQLSSATANAAMGMKPTYGKAGAISASASLLAVKQPYLFLTTPRQSLPERYQKYCGFPSNITGKLNTFSGFTVVEDIRLNGLVATSPEVAEIYELLKKGVII